MAPPIPHPIGPAIARKALPAAIPPPPDDNAPPPNHANAAFVAAAPDSADIAVPVEAVPKVPQSTLLHLEQNLQRQYR